MRRTIASILMLVMAISTVFTLASCSSDKSITFSDNISAEGTHIWFECQNKIAKDEDKDNYIIEDADDPAETVVFGRETRVIWIKVYQDGKLSTYSCLESVNLGHFSKMTDEEILKELEDTKLYVCGQKNQPYSIYLYTDAAGQEVLYEGIPSLIKSDSKKDPMYFMTLVSNGTIPTFQVYDSYYGGFELYNYDQTLFGEACLVTRCEKNDTFKLDTMELENAVLDYKTPLELLAELNKDDEDAKVDESEVSEDSEEAKDSEQSEDAEKTDDASQSDEAATDESKDAAEKTDKN